MLDRGEVNRLSQVKKSRWKEDWENEGEDEGEDDPAVPNTRRDTRSPV